ncbi:hypothetical protein B0T22DRAFT_451213 [Podospora appendiculata]|uniref:Secreted protein n=1 Tax=Podospora appendiculata TaxID=314037 RepID=A0AAE0XIJ7_9PEZI|nr:hypothetical protein B0T22DRAFT_451213 [Podospora appendiculata]
MTTRTLRLPFQFLGVIIPMSLTSNLGRNCPFRDNGFSASITWTPASGMSNATSAGLAQSRQAHLHHTCSCPITQMRYLRGRYR